MWWRSWRGQNIPVTSLVVLLSCWAENLKWLWEKRPVYSKPPKNTFRISQNCKAVNYSNHTHEEEESWSCSLSVYLIGYFQDISCKAANECDDPWKQFYFLNRKMIGTLNQMASAQLKHLYSRKVKTNCVCVCMWDERIRHQFSQNGLHKARRCVNYDVYEWRAHDNTSCRILIPQFPRSTNGTPGTITPLLATRTLALVLPLERPFMVFISSARPWGGTWTACAVRMRKTN